MIEIRKSEDRGHSDLGWLDSRHTFSFAEYYDPKHMGFRALRVINEDRVAPGRGFGAHGHADMEILSYVLSGKLTHRDSMGHEETLGPNEIQRMSAGTGVVHSEYNGSKTEPTHFLQIWLEPATRGGAPSYEQLAFDAAEKRGKWKWLADSGGTPGAARINQDAKVGVTELSDGEERSYDLAEGRHAWVQVIRGKANLNGVALSEGDAAAVSKEAALKLTGSGGDTEVLLFDLA